jgi:endonuclease YncB( thermonuclease family)
VTPRFALPLLLLLGSQLLADQPQAALQLPCKIVDVYDGDTATVEITFQMRVRLLHCWAPELRGAGGKESKENLQQYVGKPAILAVPITDIRLDKLFSFGRILGRVWVNGEDLSAVQVSQGLATESK